MKKLPSIPMPLLPIILATFLVLISFFIASSPLSAQTELVVGAVLPMTGDSAQYGETMSRGAILAIEEYNKSKPKVPIKLVIEDSQGQPKIGLNATTKLIQQDHAQALMIAFSGVISSSLPVAVDNKVVVINGPANSPKFRGASPYLFNVALLSDQEGKFLAETAYHKLGGKRVAIFYTNNDSGRGFMQVFSDHLNKLGGEVVLAEPHQQDEKDFRISIEKAKRVKPDVVFIAAYYKEASFLLKQSDEMSFKPKWLSYAVVESPELIKLADKAADGVIYSQAGFDKSKPTKVQEQFVKSFKHKYNVEPGVWAAQFYDSALVITNALKNFISPPTSEQLRATIASGKAFEGAGGPVSFDSEGLNKRELFLKQIKNGEFKLWEK